MKRWQSILLALVISVASLAYALHGVPFAQLGSMFLQGRYLYVALTLLLIVLGLWARTRRWRVLLNSRIEMRHSFSILCVSYLFNAVLPLRLGEVARASLASRLDPPIAIFTSLSTVVVERLMDVIAILVFVILAITIAPVTPEIAAAAKLSGFVAVIGVVVLMLLAARPGAARRILDVILRFAPFLERLHVRRLVDHVLEGIAPLGSVRGAFGIFAWTAISWAISAVITYVLMFTFYDRPQWNAALLITSITSLAIALPAVPGSIGPYEAATVAGLTISGMASAGDAQQQARAAACAVLYHLVPTGAFVILGVIGLAYEHISLGEVIRAAHQLVSRNKEDKADLAAVEPAPKV